MTGGTDAAVAALEAEVARLRAALGRAAPAGDVLLRLGDAIRPMTGTEEIVATASRLLGEHLGADRAAYIEVDVGADRAVVHRNWVRGGLADIVGTYPLASFGGPLLERSRAGLATAVTDTHEDPLTAAARAQWESVGVRGMLTAPLVKAGRLVNALILHTAAPRAWTEDEIALAQEVAERTWEAVERARAEAALAASEERHRLAMGAVEAMIFDWDVASGHVERSEGLRRLLGFDAAEAEPTSAWWSARIHPEDLGLSGGFPEDAPITLPDGLRGLSPAARALETGADRFAVEVRVRHRDGRWVHVRDAGTVLRDAEGRAVRVVGSSVDVTARVEAEAALRQEQERLRLALDAAAMGSFLWCPEEDRTEADAKTLDLVGRPSGPVPSFRRLLAELLHPEDRDRAAAAAERALDPAGDGTLREEVRVVLPDGAIRWLAFAGRTRSGGGRRGAARMSGTVRDVTAAKEAEAALRESEGRFRTLVEGVPQLVWRSRGGGAWDWASPQWLAYTGQSEEGSRGHGWLDAVHPDDHGAALAAWDAAGERGRLAALIHRLRPARA